jgi:D-alanyl-D-alanine carboxypeptidase (penicillin-binding protein 5/6)
VAIGVALALIPVLLIGYVVWTIRPLMDRSAGVIPPGAGVVNQPLDGPEAEAPTGGTAGLTATGARHRPLPGVTLSAGILVDSKTGRVLWMRKAHERRAIASLTKLMTVHLIAESSLGRSFAVSAQALGLPGEVLGLRAGQRVRTRDMLAAALVSSANDAAAALAIQRSGSVRGFVALMNHEARRLELRDTRFSNPSGIYDAGNHSSAWDLAQLTRVVLADKRLARLARSKVVVASGEGDYVNTNQLLWEYQGAIGVKTGFTDVAGRCLAAAATRNGRTLVAIVLDSNGSEFATATHLLDWGFRQLRRGR